MLHHVSVGRVQIKECYFLRKYTFFIKKNVFLSISILYFWSMKFSQQNIDQSETGIAIGNCQWNYVCKFPALINW